MDITNEEEGRLRIALTFSDLKHFDLTFDQLNYQDSQTRLMFRELIGAAERLTGFSKNGERTLIEVFPAPRGGCTIYFTSLDADSDADCNEPDIYCFESSGDLLDALDSISKTGTQEKCCIYLYKNKYYLCLEHAARRQLSVLLSEFSEYHTVSNVTQAYLDEHAKLLSSSYSLGR